MTPNASTLSVPLVVRARAIWLREDRYLIDRGRIHGVREGDRVRAAECAPVRRGELIYMEDREHIGEAELVEVSGSVVRFPRLTAETIEVEVRLGRCPSCRVAPPSNHGDEAAPKCACGWTPGDHVEPREPKWKGE